MTKASEKISNYRPQKVNANKHNQRGMGLLQKSIEGDGFIGAMTAAADGEIIAGSARLEKSAEVFGVDAEPIVIETDGSRPIIVKRTDIEDANEPRAKRLAIADNRVQEIDLSWDAEVLQGLNDFDEIDLNDWFNDKELTDIGVELDEPPEAPEPQIDRAEELREKWGVESGQLWQLGNHRLICGDCTDKAVVERVMDGDKCCVVSDPPYGIGYDYDIHDDNDNSENEKLIMRAFSFVDGCKIWTAGLSNISRELSREKKAKVLVWYKKFAQAGNGVGGASTWEPVFLLSPEKKELKNDVLEYSTDRIENLRELHTCPKPLGLWEDLINSLTVSLVYDPFLGSGTTLIACERLNRQCRAVEISPAYVAVALERWHEMTGEMPELLE